MSRLTGFLDQMNERDRRAILTGLAVLLPALLWVGAVRPYRAALADLRLRADTERELLAREQVLLAMAPELPDSLHTATRKAENAQRRLIFAPNVPLAESELTAYVEQIAGLSRVLIQDNKGLAPERGAKGPPGLEPIRIAVNGESDLTGVLTFLQRIEEGGYLLRIRELSIQPAEEPSSSGRGGRRGQPPRPRNVGAVEFVVVIEGYAPTEGPMPRPAPEEVSP